MKILHIHTDAKFVYLGDSFINDSFINDILFIGKSVEGRNVKFEVEYSLSGAMKAVEFANKYDMLVFYDLCYYKAYMVNHVHTNIPVIWRFFGYELYKKLPHLMYSKATLSHLPREEIRNKLKKALKSLTGNYSIKEKYFPEREFKRAVNKRIDYFLGISIEEYDFLNSFFKLPKFLQSAYSKKTIFQFGEKQGNKILIGNNSSAFNNHFDVLDILSMYPKLEKYAFLSYGRVDSYYDALIKTINGLENFLAITTFLPKDKFEDFYNKLDAFILNGYRQMAVGNIFAAFQYGVKIYMNKKNIYFYFLVNNGFLISDIKDLKNDLENGNFSLNKMEAVHNKNALENLSLKYNLDDFIAEVKRIIVDKNKS